MLEETFLLFVLVGAELSRHAPEVSFHFFCLSLGPLPSFQPYGKEMIESKKGRGLMDMDNSLVIAGEWRGIRELNGNGGKL